MGIFSLAVIDAILFTPLANDVLLVALISRSPDKTLFYVLMTVAGSVAGCVILDYFSRKGGEAGLKRTVSRKRLESIKRKSKKEIGWALVLGSTMPPPFPFTAVVAGAAAFQYPRKKMLVIIAGSRLLRFGVLGFLAYRFGPHILAIAEQPAVRWCVVGLIIVSIGGSIWTVYSQVRRR